MTPEQIGIRDFCRADIDGSLDYWYRSPPGFVESLGVDPGKMLPEREMRAGMEKSCAENESLAPADSKMPALTLLLGGRAVGIHLVNQLREGESAVFHAHLWEPGLRGKGISFRTYPLACEIFLIRFNLERILFKTPAQNIAAIRVKEKLGIRFTGQEPLDTGFLRAGTMARCFELTRRDLERILGRPLNRGPLAGG